MAWRILSPTCRNVTNLKSYNHINLQCKEMVFVIGVMIMIAKLIVTFPTV